MQPGVGTHPIKTEEKETKHLKAHNKQLHHTEETITEVEELHPDKQENGVQLVKNKLTTQPNVRVIIRKM